MNQNRLKWGSRDGKLGKLRLRFVRISKAAIQDDEAAVRHNEANLRSTPAVVVQERTAISHGLIFANALLRNYHTLSCNNTVCTNM